MFGGGGDVLLTNRSGNENTKRTCFMNLEAPAVRQDMGKSARLACYCRLWMTHPVAFPVELGFHRCSYNFF